jgi:hypothetical protein
VGGAAAGKTGLRGAAVHNSKGHNSKGTKPKVRQERQPEEQAARGAGHAGRSARSSSDRTVYLQHSPSGARLGIRTCASTRRLQDP